MFLKVDENRVVSLDSVTNINYLKDKNVLNLCYPVETKMGLISDYVYVSKDLKFKCKYFDENFIFVKGIDRQVSINKKFISSIKLDELNSKIIFSFKHAIESRGINHHNTIAEHFYVKFNDMKDAKFMFNQIIEML